MAKREYIIPIDENNRIFIHFITERGKVIEFVVKYYSRIRGVWTEVLRYDNSHGCPHKDILRPDGSKERTVWYDYLTNGQTLTFAIGDIRENYEFYLRRFKRWLRD